MGRRAERRGGKKRNKSGGGQRRRDERGGEREQWRGEGADVKGEEMREEGMSGGQPVEMRDGLES